MRNTSAKATAIIVMGLGLLGAGCASSGSSGWTKAGATDQQVEKDRLDCLVDARHTVPGPNGPRSVVDQDRYRSCMGARGYVEGSASVK